MKTKAIYMIICSILLNIQPSIASNLGQATVGAKCTPWSPQNICDTKPHIVFLIHGLMGSNGTFFELDQVLEDQFARPKFYPNGKIKKGKNLKVISINYPTNPKEFSGVISADLQNSLRDTVGEFHPHDFAHVFNTKMIYSLAIEGRKQYNQCHLQFSGKAMYNFVYKKCSELSTKKQQNICESNVNQRKNWILSQSKPKKLSNCLDNIIDVNSEYSLLGHSQGGLTAMSFINSCVRLSGTNHKRKCLYSTGVGTLTRLIRNVSDDLKSRDTTANGKNNLHLNTLELLSDNMVTYLLDDVDKDMYPNNLHYSIDAETPKRVKNLISLGSPFWGSPTANVGAENDFTLDGLTQLGVMPANQIIELAVGSRGLGWQRNLMLQRGRIESFPKIEEINKNEYLTKWPNPYGELNVYNVAGIIDDGYGANIFQEVAQGAVSGGLTKSYDFENDIIVGASEARLDFLYYVEEYNKSNNSVTKYRGRTDVTDNYAVFDFAHVPALEGFAGVPGMTKFLNNNTELGFRSNPAYIVIEKALNKEFGHTQKVNLNLAESNKLIEQGKLIEKVRNFTSEIKYITPQGYHRSVAIISRDKPEPKIKEVGSNNIESTILKTTLQVYQRSNRQNKVAEKFRHHYWQSYFHIGRFKEFYFLQGLGDISNRFNYTDSANLGVKLRYDINVLGFETKHFDLNVIPSFTSYSEVLLKPYLGKYTDPSPTSLYNEGNDIEFSKWRGEYKCQVGFMAETTPKIFKHSIKAGMQPEEYEANWKSNRIYLLPSSEKDIQFSYTDSYGNIRQVRLGNYLYRKYALNQNLVFNKLYDLDYDKDDPDWSPELYNPQIIKSGTTVEVLARVSQGHRDSFSKVGRNCTPEEIQENKLDCDTPSIDRYLITSPNIRKEDKIQISDENFGKYNDGINQGVRWVNVRDVDLIKKGDTYPLVNHSLAGQRNKKLSGFQCGFVDHKNESYEYAQPREILADYYFSGKGLIDRARNRKRLYQKIGSVLRGEDYDKE
ncbi:MAG: hypothetical protein HOO06_05275 [Bdellovibrionaceae bacterium]|nr:hypothetical protein [Pseudobdellovibrionaceae bacterium]